ncbi:MAG: hypothetical protein KME60_09380 [Cyanomargarita calcarea GSE-NOS-MK-12-04C]|jgi:hypothetical protein|uniref:Uncharacterized protein n=1 Tax=Cyanomargarita calcarea GSE-NOS-MK-12-04C TaxID=2839659 RepID=A0A951QJS5_9CYAN|nr:hypothetical protein [Cyanomargarita calcarea GSE-NOS-MK-12-04C]
MTHKIKNSDQVKLDLLNAILEPEDNTYPYNPADELSEDYFFRIEQQFRLEDSFAEDELQSQSQAFYTHLDNLWSSMPASSHYNHTTQENTIIQLQETLQSSFSTRIPAEWLKAIASRATAIFGSTQTIGEQLALCVQTVMPAWGTEDLLVLARPFAYAMRSNESPNGASFVDNFGTQDWTALSEIEQARISLAIAYYALNQLDSFQAEE